MRRSYFHFFARSRRHGRSQALVEFTLCLPIFLTMMCGVFDYGLMISKSQVLAMISREGAYDASVSTYDNLTNAISAVYLGGLPRLDMSSSSGGAIVTEVIYDSSVDATYAILPSLPASNFCQSCGMIYGGGDNFKDQSRILTNAGSASGTAWQGQQRYLGFSASILGSDQSPIYVVECFYTNQFVTPIGTLLGLVVTPILYEIAIF